MYIVQVIMTILILYEAYSNLKALIMCVRGLHDTPNYVKLRLI